MVAISYSANSPKIKFVCNKTIENRFPFLSNLDFQLIFFTSQAVLSYDYNRKTFGLSNPNKTVRWRAGGVPVDRPLCGLMGEKCGGKFIITLILALIALVIGLIIALFGFLR